MPRETSLTPEVQERYLAAIRKGNYRATAAKAANVSRSTVDKWMRLGRDGVEPYADFFRAVLEAEAQVEVEAVEKVLSAGEMDAKHFQWWLSRKFPERWADQVAYKLLKQRIDDIERRLGKEEGK